MKYSCGLIQDLLPLYLDNVCSDESRLAVDEHLEECAECRTCYLSMQSSGTLEKDIYSADCELKRQSLFEAWRKRCFAVNCCWFWKLFCSLHWASWPASAFWRIVSKSSHMKTTSMSRWQMVIWLAACRETVILTSRSNMFLLWSMAQKSIFSFSVRPAQDGMHWQPVKMYFPNLHSAILIKEQIKSMPYIITPENIPDLRQWAPPNCSRLLTHLFAFGKSKKERWAASAKPDAARLF